MRLRTFKKICKYYCLTVSIGDLYIIVASHHDMATIQVSMIEGGCMGDQLQYVYWSTKLSYKCVYTNICIRGADNNMQYSEAYIGSCLELQ